MTVVINGTTGITNDGGYTGDGIVFANTTPANTLVTDTSGNVGIGTSSPSVPLHVSSAGAYKATFERTDSTNAYITFEGTSTTGNNGIGTSGDNVSIITGGTERAVVTSAGLFQFNSGYGSVATAYGCRAWVNFNGTGTVAIRASGNVSSITDRGTGAYTVNFSTAMPDANYSICGAGNEASGTTAGYATIIGSSQGMQATSNVQIWNTSHNSTAYDGDCIRVSIFR